MRRHRFLLFLAAVFAAKLVVVLQLRDHPLLQADASQVSPLYALFLGAFAAAGAPLAAVRVAQIAIGTAAVACVFVGARAWFGERAGWVAAVFAALTGLFTFYETLILPSALDPFLTASALAVLALGFAAPGRTRANVLWLLAAGGLFGVLVLNRPHALLPAIAIAAVLAALRRIHAAALVTTGLAIVLLPAAIHHSAVSGEWSPLARGGLTFYIGNNPESDGTYRPVAGLRADIREHQNDAHAVAEASLGRDLDAGGVSRYFYGLGWSWIRLHPGDALAHFSRKLALAFNAGFIAQDYSYPFYARDMRTLLALLFVGPWLLLPIGLVGLVAGAPRNHPAEYLIWASFVPLYAVSIAVFFVIERYRLPLLIPLCIGAGAAVELLVLRSSPARSLVVRFAALAAVLLAAVLANRPAGRDDGRAEERTRMAEALIVRDRADLAEEWAAKAAAIHPRPATVHLRVGRRFTVHSRPAAAIAHLQRALREDPRDPDVHYAMGQALLEARRPREAIPWLRDATKAGARVNLAGYDLARALAATGDRAGALQTLQAVRPDSPSDVQGWYALGQLAMQLESPSLAAAFFNPAIAASPRAAAPRQDLGRALLMMGRAEEAIVQLEQAAALAPADPAAQLNLAIAYAQAGRTADARARAEEALRLTPGYKPARQFLEGLK